jgi:toxin FitB
MNEVIIDTNIASLSLKRTLPASIETRLEGRQTMISFVTYAEMVEWSVTKDWGPRLRGRLDHWLDQRTTLSTDEEVCEVAGRIAARAELRGQRKSENDTWIAAVCISHGIPLATRNVKDFADFAVHEGLELIEV